MVASLSRLASLPAETMMYCAHEYTETNLRFARHVEPSNVHTQRKLERVQHLRRQGLPTVPSTIGEERLTNPFLRTNSPEIANRYEGQLGYEGRVGNSSGAPSVLGALRAEKEAF
jgi:hydroxyacylglutathione hydrolase